MDDLQNALGVESNGEAEFLKKFTTWGKEDEETPSSPKDEQPAEEAEDTPEDAEDEPNEDEETPSEDGEEESEDKASARKYVDDDESVAKIKVGDEEHEVAVKDLKRLWGQESALTKKSQELATLRTKLEEDQKVHSAASNLLLEAARKRYEPYAKIDFLALSRRSDVSPEQFQALREEAQHRWEELNFHEQQQKAWGQHVAKQQQELIVAEAKESIKLLQDNTSPYHIADWNQQLYDELRTFAVSSGVPQQVVNSITSAPIIKLLHSAMVHAKGQTVKDVKTVKVAKKTTKIVKTSHSPVQASADKTKFGDSKKAMANLKRSGSVKAAEDAFMASFREFESE